MNKVIIKILLLLGWGGVIFSSCSSSDKNEIDEPLNEPVKPELLSMSFKASCNPYQLISDVKCDIIGDSIVDCWVKNIMPNKELVASFSYNGNSLLLNGQPANSDITICNYSAPVKLLINSGNLHKEYTILVHSFTGLPVVWIETEDRKEIVSKEEYIKASVKLEENIAINTENNIIVSTAKIKGRGNSSWNGENTKKKSFTLKFDQKISLLREPKDKSYVLIANSFDKSMLRNYIAYFIGKLSKIDYTPSFHFVELILNGNYNGTYLLGDKLKISKERVNVGDDGFLMEFDSRAPQENETPYFYTNHLSYPINIKDPDVEIDSESYNYIKDFVTNAENVLFSDDFQDPVNGWQKFFDIDTAVDWYIIHEIAKNYDALFLYTSAYMNLQRGGKIKMGPIWDFDVTFGNNTNPLVYPVEGLAGERSSWFYRLLQDRAFVEKVQKRYDYFYNKRDDIFNEINEKANYLKYSVIENDNKWNVFYHTGFGNHDVWGSYENEVELLKEYIYKRMEWLKIEFDKM